MSDSNRAVFLSYASQDAAAVARLAEALRAAGVEVWFDQDELVGGDAWDAKIRKQIAECALFVPVISAATQARGEGYFRIEWRLAAQRTHAMADDETFLLPVVIDETRDAEARVPAEFKAVQWTRLPGGEAAEKFCGRVKRLLLGAEKGGDSRSDEISRPKQSGHKAPPTAIRRGPVVAWALGGLAVLVAASAGLWLRRPAAPPVAMTAPKSGPTVAANPLERVATILDKPDVTRAELDLANEMLAQAAAADPGNARVFALWARVDCRFLEESYDHSPARRDAARRHAAQAASLAPDAAEVRLARAVVLQRLGADAASKAEAKAIFTGLVAEAPNDPSVLLALAWIAHNAGDRAAAQDWVKRASAVPAAAARVAYERGLMAAFSGDFGGGLAAIDEAVAVRPAVKFLMWKSYLETLWLGDPAAARRTLARVPAEFFAEDLPASAKFFVESRARDFAAALETVRAIPRDFMQSNAGAYPTGYFRGLALHWMNRKSAAQSEWEGALATVEKRLLQERNEEQLLMAKAVLLAALGRKEEAAEVHRTALELHGENNWDWLPEYYAAHQLAPAAWVERLRRRVSGGFRWYTAAELRLGPLLDRMRTDPAFQALQAEFDANPKYAPQAAARPTAAGAPDKSVAVLPFANLTPDKDNEYFADGIHVELLDRLQALRELRVVSHQSVIGYRGTTKRSPEIARELGVTYLLSGSVRRSGDLVRVAVQLVDARSDTQIWSLPPEERKVENVFAVQAEIAQSTAKALRAVLSPGEQAQLVRPPTGSVAAYELFLRARELAVRDPFARSTLQQSVQWLKSAVGLDPRFARAWAQLSGDLIEIYFLRFDSRPEVLAEAKRALDQAVELAPDSLESQLGLARYRYQGLRDYDGALSLLSRLAAQYPTNPEVIRMPGLIYRRQGNWPAALASLRQAVTLDRGDASLLRSLTQTLRAARRWDEALTEQRRLVALVPGVVWEGYYLGEIPFLASGSRREMSDYIGELERVQGPNGPEVIEVKKRWAIQRGDFADAVRLDGLQPFSEGDRSTEASRAGQAAMVLLAAGKAEVAKQRIERFLPEVRRRAQELSDDYVLQLTWARMELVLGHGSEAVRLGERTLAVVEKSDLWNAAGIRAQLAGLLAWAGQKERALDELERSLREPGGARVYEARSSAWYLPLRGEPRFEAMLADPKNNAPLF